MIKKFLASTLIITTIATINLTTVNAANVDKGSTISDSKSTTSLVEGWNVISIDNICYVRNGVKLTGWQKIYTAKYLKENLIPDSNCSTFRLSKKAEWYYFDASGNMKTGWLNDNGTWYYLDQEGIMVTGNYVDGFYLNDDGAYVYGKTTDYSRSDSNYWGEYDAKEVSLVWELYESNKLDESHWITERQFKTLKESGHIGAKVDYTQVTPDGKKIGDLCFYYK